MTKLPLSIKRQLNAHHKWFNSKCPLGKLVSMLPEARVKDKIKKLFVTYGAYYDMPHQSGYGTAGVPDFQACCAGWFLGVEAKGRRGKLSPIQRIKLNEIRDAGGIALVTNEHNLTLLEDVLKCLTKK